MHIANVRPINTLKRYTQIYKCIYYIRYYFIEDQDCTKLTKEKTPNILMSLYESYLT